MYCVSSRHKCLHQDQSDKTSGVLSGRRKIKGKSGIESNQMKKQNNQQKNKKNKKTPGAERDKAEELQYQDKR